MAEKNKDLGSESPVDALEEPSISTVTDVISEENCVFCRIAKKEVPANIVYEDQDFIVFTDRKPVSDHHYLVIPRQHIRDPRVLTKDDIPLVEKMVSIGKRVLQEKGGSEEDSRMGFHWPPFLFVKHLHLHVMAPVANMSWFQRSVIFRVDSMVFSTPPCLIQYLKDKN
ncbi:adenosine 5'-monophosphoramidase HINT3-like [Halichondria panicea]|uniref:adenosine 5'-monophosphoramidase HINT3-like n=1 Tax=Halichondria panicea TaxID=6063 RepID=UPI00312B6F52